MAADARFGTVVYLQDTGHVLAAVTCGRLQPEVADLTGGKGIRVRLPGEDLHVDVPDQLLAVKRVAVTDDVLDRPLFYILGQGAAPLTLGDGPSGSEPAADSANATKKYVVVWQGDDGAVPETGTVPASGVVPSSAPPNSDAKLLAVQDGPLVVRDTST